jgi:UDP-N-acetylglucosamine 4,6-dehydratase
MWIDGKVILLTGGTGSFGNAFVKEVLAKHKPATIRVFSRDELKQHNMQQLYPNEPRLRFIIGDIRDRERVYRAMDGVDLLVHAAALKQVPTCEYNPFEAVKTNILGAQNLIDAALDHQVQKVIALSTDKAVNPVNLYGATKLCMEKAFVQGNSYRGKHRTILGCVRYGNVVGSRGSVIPLFNERRSSGILPITDLRMTRYMITLPQAVEFVLKSLERLRGGEVFVPKIPSSKIGDLARVMAPECKVDLIGIRPGEKLDEILITTDESRHTLEYDDYFAVEPEHSWWSREEVPAGGRKLADGFSYTSGNNTQWLSDDELREMIRPYVTERQGA